MGEATAAGAFGGSGGLAGAAVAFAVEAAVVGAGAALAGQYGRGLNNWDQGQGFFNGLGQPSDMLT